ncbi:glycosyltransferase [Celeribacter ethanolicus]|uniref:glycosyltransferase n=1 Tax=Celeribacter ethanolicus TaxID=1758178 RepID=UPI00083252BD|nr:glycosyltransferase [Celeribacter ethanolicus]
MKACIATGTYHAAGETFVNRHIAELFGGNTCVLFNTAKGDNPLQKPNMSRRNRFEASPRKLWQTLRELPRYGTTSLPHGKARSRVEAFLRDQKPDLILAEFGPEAVALTPLARALDLPLFGYFRGYDASKLLRDPGKRRAYRKCMPHWHGVFAVSQFLLDNLAAHDIAHPRSAVIPSGVNTELFHPAEKRSASFLYVGRLIEKKAPDLVLRAFLDAATRVTDAHLTIIGDGTLSAPCQALVAARGMQDRVTFTGALPHSEVCTLMSRTAILLQHSVTARNGNTEGLPTSIQEAMASGMAVLSTRHAGIPEAVVEGENGLLVTEHDEAGFRDGIVALANAPETVARMGADGRRRAVAQFDNRTLLAALEARLTGWL